jgi:hypothetical protein
MHWVKVVAMVDGRTFDQLKAAIGDLFELPNGAANITALQGWVRDLRLAGLKVESLEDGLRLGLLDDFVSGGSYSGIDPTRRHAGHMYRSLGKAERQSLTKLYADRLEKARRDLPHVFHVQVINVPAAPADFLAERPRGRELPHLNADQKSMAKALGIPEQEYARSVEARQFSEERYRFHAERCWDFLMEAARAHSIDVVDVIYDVSAGRFYCELRQDGDARRFFLDARVVSEPLQQGDRIGLERARQSIQFAVEQALTPRAVVGTSKGQ